MVPDGATNLGLIGQYVEVPGHSFHHRIVGPHGVGSGSPPAQARPRAAARLSSQYDPKALFAAFKVLVWQ